jgi:hypothetical protein
MCKCNKTSSENCGQDCGCKFEVDAGCVRYSSDALPTIDVKEGDLLETILHKIDSIISDTIEGLSDPYILPRANDTRLGGVKIGTNIQVTEDGVISVDLTGLEMDWGNILNTPTTISEYGITDAVQSNSPITAGTHTKITYDEKGLILSATNATTDDITEGDNQYFTQTRVRSTPLTGLSVSGTTVSSTDTILQAMGKLQNQINSLLGSMSYQGVWNANTNSPTLTSSTGTKGYVYKVTVAGSTNLDGITDWKAGDFAVFNGSTWDKWDSTDAITSINGYTSGSITLTTDDVSEGSTNRYWTNARTIASVLTSFVSGAGTVSSSDTVLSALQKIVGNIDLKIQSTGSNTTNRLMKWSSATTASDSQITDDGTTLAIGTPLSSGAKIVLATSSQQKTIWSNNSANNGQAIYGVASGTGTIYGVFGQAFGATATNNYGVTGYADNTSTGTNIGISGYAGNGVDNYAIQLQDGTEGAGKYLKAVTSDGKGHWSTITSSDITGGASGSFTSQDGKTITVTNGIITSIV